MININNKIKLIFVISFSISLFLFLLILINIPKIPELVLCTSDAKICPDGSGVGRDAKNNCEFFPCPDNKERNYQSRDLDECKRMQIFCVEGYKHFSDGTGCGCQKIQKTDKEYKNFCKTEDREVEACIEIYKPVCGWNDPERIQCIRYPCASTYSNGCYACQNPNVIYYTESECPKGFSNDFCEDTECGVKPLMPNFICDDGETIAGPGDCRTNENGECIWQIISCPD